MTVPVVLVDLAHPSAPQQEVAIMLEACSRAAGPSRCVLRRPLEPDERPASVAKVVWFDPSDQHVRVELSPAREPSQPLSQELDFRADDVSSERWRSVGLTVGTLANEAAARQTPVAPSARTTPPPLAPPPRGSAPSVRYVLAAGGLTGPGLEAGPWRFGGWGRGSLESATVPLAIHLEGSHAVAAGDAHGVSAAWTTVALGVGSLFQIEPLRLRAYFEVAGTAERVRASVAEPSTGERDHGARWVPGARGGAELRWPARGQLGVLGGGQVWWTPSATDVLVRGAAVTSSANAGVTLRLGLFLSFP